MMKEDPSTLQNTKYEVFRGGLGACVNKLCFGKIVR